MRAEAAVRDGLGLGSAVRTGLFEGVFVALSAWVAVGAYFDALTYVRDTNGQSLIGPWQGAVVHAGWFTLLLWMLLWAARARLAGAPWTHLLPAGYGASFAAAVTFAFLLVADQYLQLALGPERGLGALVSPARFAQIIAGTVMITGPLRAAWQRGDAKLGWAGVGAASLLLAALSFATQFSDPVRDPLAMLHPLGSAGPASPPYPLSWILQDSGLVAILVQASLIAGFTLFLLRRFEVPAGAFTVALTVDGLLTASLKGYWPLAIAMFVTGVVADVLLVVLKPRAVREVPLRAFSVAVPAVFAGAVLGAIWLAYGTWWDAHIVLGAVVAAGAAGWLTSFLAFPAARRLALVSLGDFAEGGAVNAAAERVKEALEALDDPGRLAVSPLLDLPLLSGGRAQRVAELRELLIDVVSELTVDHDPRDAEAGRVLFEYYIRHAGKHEQIAERLHLSRITHFRRLQRGLELTAERIHEKAFVTPA